MKVQYWQSYHPGNVNPKLWNHIIKLSILLLIFFVQHLHCTPLPHLQAFLQLKKGNLNTLIHTIERQVRFSTAVFYSNRECTGKKKKTITKNITINLKVLLISLVTQAYRRILYLFQLKPLLLTSAVQVRISYT